MYLLPSGKARFNWNIEAALRKRFDEICELKGYQKQMHVERMIKEWIAREESTVPQSSKGVQVREVEGFAKPPKSAGRGVRGERSA